MNIIPFITLFILFIPPLVCCMYIMHLYFEKRLIRKRIFLISFIGITFLIAIFLICLRSVKSKTMQINFEHKLEKVENLTAHEC